MGLIIDFCVLGTPASFRSKPRSRQRWRDKIIAAIQPKWAIEKNPLNTDVNVQVMYLYEGHPLDLDNMIKPILDAMTGIIYEDDVQVTKITTQRKKIGSAGEFDNPTTDFAQALSTLEDFVRVEVFDG